ncbi:MAG TPA: nuclear transport factor 2 family protein [Gemmatimonadales bacterium]|nr:nuclear transport factor 2 family protein [Gemmatimonadales bacterium]
MRPLSLALTLALVSTASLHAQTAADSAGIRAAALDYAEGWFEGNADRMARAVSPELVKRIVVRDTASGKDMIQGMGSTVLVNSTRRGFGKSTPADKQEKDVRIYDIFRGAAIAKVTMTDWIDYLQLARVDGRWVIVNVLWERKTGPMH